VTKTPAPGRFGRVGTHRLTVGVLSHAPDGASEYEAALEVLGHEVVVNDAGASDLAGVVEARPDVVLVTAGEDVEEALAAIDVLVAESACPVVAVGPAADPTLAQAIAERGVFGYAGTPDPEQLQATIEVACLRFAEFANLDAALQRRSHIEQAKGILMERHSIDERAAFEMLRAHARRTNRKVAAVAAAVIDGHRLLPGA
jgi:AmiR/NasT family two-component response regulator